MARQFKDSRFLIIEGTSQEFQCIGFGIEVRLVGHIIVCDNCNSSEHSDEWYYIPVLNRVFCKKCFEHWNKTATYYEEDAEYERRYFEIYKNELSNNGFWED